MPDLGVHFVDSNSRRDAAFTALFLGFFAAAWFGWAQAASRLTVWLAVASVASLLVAVAGGIVGFGSPGVGSAMRDRRANRRYGVIVGIEFASAFAGAALLGMTGAAAYVPVWVCAVVGVHFFPLAPVLRDRGLYPLGVAMCAVAAAGLVTALTTGVAASTVVGIGAGVLLLGYAVVGLVRAARRVPR
jgi:hypothetical protein